MNLDTTDSNENMDMPAHLKTYGNFMRFVKYGIATVATILILMAIFLV